MIDTNYKLILIRGEDKTAGIDTCEYCNGKYNVTFLNGKTYPYNFCNVEVYKNPKVIDLKNTLILKNNLPLYMMKQVLAFDRHTKITYENGTVETLENTHISYIHSVLNKTKSSNCFAYLKQTAKEVSLKTEDGISILGRSYEKISFVREDCMLAAYISGELQSHKAVKKEIVYPFGFNLSQKQAVENALRNPLSIIEGPPGTGKTQTILNIIANAVMYGESVAVVSSNNSATQNVLEKMENSGIGFIAAYLGSGEHKKEFIEQQDNTLPDIKSWKLSGEEYGCKFNEIGVMALQLDEMLEAKNTLSKLRQEYEAVSTEYQHFLQYYNETNAADIAIDFRLWVDSQKIMDLLIANDVEERAEKMPLLHYIINFFKYGIKNRSFYQNSKEQKIAICQKKFYEMKIKELEAALEQLETKLQGYYFEEKRKEYTALSLVLLRAKLAEKYSKIKCRKLFETDDLWKNSQEFIHEYPVILSTTYSLRSSLSAKFVYDYVIVDEASQVDIATGALALSCARKAVIVGDLKQLPNVVTAVMKKRTDTIFGEYQLPEAYRYSNHSLLLSVSELFGNAPHTLLREHYRCHPQIIEFCNQKFYHGELVILTEGKSDRKPLMVYKTVEGNHSRERINIRQIDVIKNEVIPQQKIDAAKDSVGIVTPYRNQTMYLQEAFKGTKVRADTVDKFQGQECDIIILSTVDDEITEFADNPNRLNVAVSRAVNQLIVVTDGNNQSKDSNVKDLIEYIGYQNYEVIESKIYSVFDYLYKSYHDRKEEYLKNKKRVSDFDSENLMYHVIVDSLRCHESFGKLGVATHVPLRMILRDLTEFEEAEVRYVMAPGTHVDFLIFSKLSRMPLLIVEVDGYEYHKNGTKQALRDVLKDTILDKYELPFIRFGTNESNEKERLLKKLEECMEISK